METYYLSSECTGPQVTLAGAVHRHRGEAGPARGSRLGVPPFNIHVDWDASPVILMRSKTYCRVNTGKAKCSPGQGIRHQDLWGFLGSTAEKLPPLTLYKYQDGNDLSVGPRACGARCNKPKSLGPAAVAKWGAPSVGGRHPRFSVWACEDLCFSVEALP